MATSIMFLFLLIGMLISPILDELINYILLWIEVLKIKPTKVINIWNKEIQQDINEDYPTDTNVIGFQYSPPDEEYYEDEEYENV